MTKPITVSELKKELKIMNVSELNELILDLYKSSNQVKEILSNDYSKIEKDQLRIGDVIIYKENGNIKHSTTFLGNNMSIGKNGFQRDLKIANIREQWPNADLIEYYRYWRIK